MIYGDIILITSDFLPYGYENNYLRPFGLES
jgi:hypothetical protein